MNEHRDIIAQLADRAADRLSPEAAARLKCHLENCPECREQARRFMQSYQTLEKVLEDMTSPSLFAGVKARLEHPEPRRAFVGLRPAWAGITVLSVVLVFSALMSRPGITTEQVLQDYSEDVQTLWEGGTADAENAWLPSEWSETTGLESSGSTLENII